MKSKGPSVEVKFKYISPEERRIKRDKGRALAKAWGKIKKVNKDNYNNMVLQNYDWIYTMRSETTFQELKKRCDKNELPPWTEINKYGGRRLLNHGDITLYYDGLEKIGDSSCDPLPRESQYVLVKNNYNDETVGLFLKGDIEGQSSFFDWCNQNGDNGFRVIGYVFQDPIAIKKREIELEKSAKVREFKEHGLYPVAAVVIFISLIFIIEKCRGVI